MMKRKIRVQSGAYIMAAWLLLCLPIKWFLAMIISTMVHEMGHLLALRLCKVKIQHWDIGASGMSIATEPMDNRKECLCSVAGPLIGIALFFASLSYPQLAVCALIHSVFNLLPIWGLDGYRVLLCVLKGCMRWDMAERTMEILQWGMGALLLSVGAWATFVLRMGVFPLLFGLYALRISFSGKRPCKLAK